MSLNLSKRLTAERLYINDGWTAKSIAYTVGVTENTVGTWVKKYDWKNKRNEVLAAPHKIKTLLLTELQSVLEGGDAKFNSDDVAKITRALERIDKGVNIQVIITAFKMFTDWLTNQKLTPELLESIVGFTKDFIRYSINNE